MDNLHDCVSVAVYRLFNSKVLKLNETNAGRKVLAGFVLEDPQGELTVISFGTGEEMDHCKYVASWEDRRVVHLIKSQSLQKLSQGQMLCYTLAYFHKNRNF